MTWRYLNPAILVAGLIVSQSALPGALADGGQRVRFLPIPAFATSVKYYPATGSRPPHIVLKSMRFDTHGWQAQMRGRCLNCGRRTYYSKIDRLVNKRYATDVRFAIIETKPGTVGRYFVLTRLATSDPRAVSRTCLPLNSRRPTSCAKLRSRYGDKPVSFTETTGAYVQTWTNYSDAGGTQGKTIPKHHSVQVTCRLRGYKVKDGDDWWYLIASSPWNNKYYASADPFYNNGRTDGSLNGTPSVDQNVAICTHRYR
jgi:hypothetical protein